MERIKKNRYFGSRDFYKSAILIGVPVMVQALLQSLVSLIDSFMVAGLGDVKMAGVNISGQILYIFMVLQTAVCTSGGIYMTQYFGAKDKKGMQQSFAFKVVISFSMIFLYFLVTFVFNREILSLMVIGNSQAEMILDQGQEYMFLMGFVGIQTVISYIIASSYREIGKVKVPLIITVFAAVINTFLNWVLIYGNLGMPRLEIRGAAYATIIARTVEMILFVIYTMIDKSDFIGLSVFRNIDWKLFGEILKKGSLLIISQLLWVASESVTTAIYNGRGGADVVSGMAASFSIANLFFISFSGINTATSVVIGKSLGAGKLEQARNEKTWMLSAALIFGTLMTFVGFATTALAPIVYKQLSFASQGICRSMLIVISVLMPVWIYVNTQLSITKAGGDTKVCMLVDGIVSIIVIPYLLLLAHYTAFSPMAMYLLVKMLDFGKVAIAQYELKREKWVVNLSAR